jgi:hypothetical protein
MSKFSFIINGKKRSLITVDCHNLKNIQNESYHIGLGVNNYTVPIQFKSNTLYYNNGLVLACERDDDS